jgi:hypothetical protein
LPGVPREWPDDNYDYFWIVDFPENSNVPSKFEMVKQEFGKSFPGVPREWPDDNFDYFWIVDFPENSNVPSKFEMVKQEFGKSFPDVPANAWGEPNGLDDKSGCVK